VLVSEPAAGPARARTSQGWAGFRIFCEPVYVRSRICAVPLLFAAPRGWRVPWAPTSLGSVAASGAMTRRHRCGPVPACPLAAGAPPCSQPGRRLLPVQTRG
jgi:hypothetical protein